MKKGIVALIILAAIPFFYAQAYTSPGKPTGFVNDFAGIISTAEKVELETTLTALKKETGAEIVVVTVPALGDEVVETYAVKLFEEWGIGEKGKDNGLLLLIALQEKKMRIEVGYGLEGDITDAQASQIIRTILTPAFKEGKYEEGIAAAVGTIVEVIRKNPEALPVEETASFNLNSNWIYLAIFIFMWVVSILGRSKSWWLGGVLGGVAGVIAGVVIGSLITGGILTLIFIIIGLVFDFIVSKAYQSSANRGVSPPWWIGGGRGGSGGGGGFGGFGGGRSGGGGASGGW